MIRCPHCHQEFDLAPKKPLTKRQAEILQYITEFGHTYGYMPTFAQIAKRFNLRSLATVHEHLCNLEWKGHIKRTFTEARAVVLL